MNILIDTNVFIMREADRVILSDLTALENILKKNKASIIIHPGSVIEVDQYDNPERKRIALSKIKAYPKLENPPDYTKDSSFLEIISKNTSTGKVDNSLLYAVCKNAVDFLITQDRGMLIQANAIGIKQRVLSIEEALSFLMIPSNLV